ncbi:hypothetical protein KGA66_22775 [Actinocrinis puniceicyclus]|uniref:Uncharacterized protein n=1 Tax=Actinocrinis puniceicyclus TaxID=977794 RepID=A0A8J7WNZ0_9ACTN|nr:hypothetical protein [Actinocrinis puniceicyclus]MBS2965891.1 hypothetical protein [Actinocrinis puniceicyclus]
MLGKQEATAAATRALGWALVVAGPVLARRGLAAGVLVRSELADEHLAFPDSVPQDLARYAGQSVDSASLAKVYADLIKRNVYVATGGRTYAQLSAGRPDSVSSEARDTAFRGEAMHAGLLGAYEAAEVATLVTGLGVLATALGAVLLAVAGSLEAPALPGGGRR